MATPASPATVLVTGSSSGIGRATAEALARQGWRVWGASRRPGGPDDHDARLWRQLRLDVTDDQSIADAIAEILETDGRLDALVHCAGISVAGAIEDVTRDEALHQLTTNYLGSVSLLRAVLPSMRQRGGGRIIVIGSIGGLIGLPFIGHYSASKFALGGMLEALRHEVGPFGIQVTVLHPGDIKTEISHNQIEGRATAKGHSAYYDRFRAAIDTYDKAVEAARAPEVIARDVVRILARRRQPPQHIAGTPTEVGGVVLRAILPRAWFEKILAQSYGF